MRPGFGVDGFWRMLAAIPAALCIFLSSFGCEAPPEAPPSEIDVGDEREALEERVDEIRSEARERVEQAADDIPGRDAGGDDAATPQ